MAAIQSRTCNLCGVLMKGGRSGFEAHGEAHHPNYQLTITGTNVKFTEKAYYCPLDSKWYSCLKWLSRAITKHGWTNEQYYLKYGEQYVQNKWIENSSRPLFGHRHCTKYCLACNTQVKFNESAWKYPVFCGYKCSAAWYANNTDKVSKSQTTLRERKSIEPDHALNPTQIRYWIVRHGMDETHAKQKVAERQSVNKLEDYITRANGDTETGRKLFADRQSRWLASLKKTGMKKGSSDISARLFESVSHKISDLIYGKQEAVIKVSNTTVKVDCLLASKNRIIEFYGDYWHGNPQIFGPNDTVAIRKTAHDVWLKDQLRVNLLQAAGYQVLIIWEKEFSLDPQSVIDRCVTFLNS